MFLTPNRWKHFAAMVLIGDGVMALIHPQKDALAWKGGPQVWQDLMHELHQRPALTRVIGSVQIAAGVWCALQQESEKKEA